MDKMKELSEKKAPKHGKQKEQMNNFRAGKTREKELQKLREQKMKKEREKMQEKQERSKKAQQKNSGAWAKSSGYGPQQIHIRNDSGTQVNSWGNMTPEDVMSYAKANKSKYMYMVFI